MSNRTNTGKARSTRVLSTGARRGTTGRVVGGGQLIARGLLLAVLAGSVHSTAVAQTPTGPQNPQVVSGSARVTQSGSRWTIVTSNTAIINYSSFNLNAGQGVRFIQPSASSRVLNRITGAEPTRINGRIDANGTVYFVNRAGVFFGPNATINTGQFYAAAGSLSNRDFLGRVDRFTDVRGVVENRGSIVAQNSVSLVGAQVANYGTISGLEGSVVMAAGDEVIVTQRGGRLSVRVTGDSTPGNDTDQAALASVYNAGNVSARLGITAAAGDIASLAIANTGTMRAQTVELQGGRGNTLVSGTIDASNAQGRGGRVDITGERIALVGATINASGTTGGGQVNIGGELNGGGTLPRAQSTYVSSGSSINASATIGGNGGQIVIWSDQVTGFYGSARADGAGTGGNGGLIETSSAGSFNVSGSNISAQAGVGGSAGLWLIDPFDVEIIAGATNNGAFALGVFTPSATPSQVSAVDIVAALFGTNGANGTNVQITTTGVGFEAGNITINAAINATNSVARTLTFTALGGIIQNAAVTATVGSLNLVYDAAGATVIGANTTTLGGSVTVNGTDFNLDSGQTIVTGGGAVNLTGTGAVNINGTLNMQGSAAGIAGGALTASGSIFIVGGTGSVDTSGNGNANGGVITLTTAGQVILNGTVTTNGNVVGSSISAAPAFSALNASDFGIGAAGGLTVGTGTRSGNVSISTTGNITIAGPLTGNTIGGVGSVFRLRSTGGDIAQNTNGIIVGGTLVALAPAGSVLLGSLNNNLQTATDTTGVAGLLGGLASGNFEFSNGGSLGLNPIGAQGSFGVVSGIASTTGDVSIATRNTNSIFQLSGSGANQAGITATNGVVTLSVVGTGSLAVEQGALAPITAIELVLNLVNPGGGLVGGQFLLNGTDNRIALLTANLGGATAALTNIRLLNHSTGAGLADWELGNVALPTGAATNFLRVSTARAVTQDAGTSIQANGLLLAGTGSYLLINTGNTVTTLAAGTSGNAAASPSAIDYRDDTDLTVGTVDGVSGITTNAGSVTLLLDAGALVIEQAINLGATGGTLRIDADGVSQSGAGIITANALGVTNGTGVVTLSLGNDVNTVAIGQTAAADVAFTGTGGYDIGTVAGTSVWNGNAALDGITTAGSLVTLSALSGTVTQSFAINVDGLELLGAGNFNLGTQNNNVTTVAADLTGAASFMRFRDDNGFSVGTAGATSGITTGDAGGNVCSLFLSGSNITQTEAITTNWLCVLATDGVDLTNAGNNINFLEGSVSNLAGTFEFRNSGALTIGRTGENDGVATNDGDIAIQTGGLLTIAERLSAGAAGITITSSNGATQSGTGIITASTLLLGGAGTFNLLTLNNDVDTFAGVSTGGTRAILFRDDDGFAIGSGTVLGVTREGLDVGTGGLVVLESDGAVTQGAAGNQAVVTGGLALQGDGEFTLDNTLNDAETLAANTGGQITYFDLNSLTVGTVDRDPTVGTSNLVGITTTGDNVTLRVNVGGAAAQRLAITQAIDLGATGGTLTLLAVTGPGAEIGGAASGSAADAAITANALVVHSAGQDVLLNRATAGVPINDINAVEGVVNSTGRFNFSTQGDLNIGGLDPGVLGVGTDNSIIRLQATGRITLLERVNAGINAGAINTASVNNVDLQAGNGVVQPNTGTGVITADVLTLAGTGAFLLNTQNNRVLTLQAPTMSGGAQSIRLRALDTLVSLGLIGDPNLARSLGVLEIQTNQSVVQLSGTRLRLDTLVLSGNGSFTLLEPGLAIFGNNDIATLVADLGGGASSIVISDSNGFDIGSGQVTRLFNPDDSVHTDGTLDNFGGVRLAQYDAVNPGLAPRLVPGADNDLVIIGGNGTNGVTQSAPIIADGLGLAGDGPFVLTDAGNLINQLASLDAGAITLVNGQSLIIGAIDGVNVPVGQQFVGINNDNAEPVLTPDLTLRITAGSLRINDPINLGGTRPTNRFGTFRATVVASVTAGGVSQASTGVITAAGLGVINDEVPRPSGAREGIQLFDADNRVNTVALRNIGTGPGTQLSFNGVGTAPNSTSYTIGTITGAAEFDADTGTAGDQDLVGISSGDDANGEQPVELLQLGSSNGVSAQTAALNVTALALLGSGGHNLGTQNNAIGTVAASMTDAGAGNVVRIRDDGGLVIGTVATIINSAAGTISGLDLGLQTGDIVAISSDGAVTQAGAGDNIIATNLILRGAGQYELNNIGNDVDVLAASLTGATATASFADDDGFEIGAVTDSGGSVIGININNGAADANDLRLRSNGAVTQTEAIVADGLFLERVGITGSFTLTDEDNNIEELAALNAGDIILVNNDNIVIGTVGASNGIDNSANGGSLTLRTLAGGVAINQAVNLGTATLTRGTLRITSVGSSTNSGVSQNATGVITAARIGVINNETARAGAARVGIVLNAADNVADVIALRNIATGASSQMAYRGIGTGANTTSYTIGTVTGAAEFDADGDTAGNQDLIGLGQRQTPAGVDEGIRLLSLTSNDGRAAQDVAFEAALLALRGNGGFIFDTQNNIIGTLAGALTDNGAGNVVRIRDDANIALGTADTLNGVNLGQQVGDLLVLQSNGDITQAANAPINATGLALRGTGGNRNLRTSTSNNVQNLASTGSVDFQYLDTDSFSVNDVDGIAGIAATGLIDLDAGGGSNNTITIARDVVTTVTAGSAVGGPLGVRGVILRDRALISGPRTIDAGAGIIRLMNGADAAGGGGSLILSSAWPVRGLATNNPIDADAQSSTPPTAPPDVPAIGVAGSIGAVTPLDSLQLGTNLVLGPGNPNASTIVFANVWGAVNSAGNANLYNNNTDIGNPLRVGNGTSTASNFTIATTGNLTVGNLQRLLSFGNLTINAGGGTVRLGDVTTVGNLSVTGGAIQIVPRPLGQIIRSNRLSENEIHPGDVSGTDIVANRITFSTQPTIVSANGVNAANVVRGNVFGLFNIGGSSVPGFTTVQDGFRLIRNPVTLAQFRNVNSAGQTIQRILSLDVDSRGDTAFTGSVIPPLFTIFDLPEVDQGVRITGAVEDFLRRLQVNVTSEDATALASALIGTAVFNNDTVAIDSDEPAFQSVLSSEHRISIGRLNNTIATDAKERYDELFIGPDAANPIAGQMKRRLGELHTAWIGEVGGGGSMADFRAYIAANDVGASTFLDQLSNFLTDFGFVGLTGSEFSVPRAALLNQVRPTDMDADGGVIEPSDFFQLVTGQRAPTQVATRSIELRFDQVFLTQVPRLDENGQPMSDGSTYDRFNAMKAALGNALKAYGQANAGGAKDGRIAGSSVGFIEYVNTNDPVAADYLREVKGFLSDVQTYARDNNVDPTWADDTQRKTLDMIRPGNIDPAAFADLILGTQVSSAGW